MNSFVRKLLLLLASLALAFGVFLLYDRFSGMPAIDLDVNSGYSRAVADANEDVPRGGAGKIGSTVIDRVTETDFVHRDENGVVDRKMGFAELTNTVKDIWAVEKPYMSVIQRGFECHITADRGNFQLDTSLGAPTPKDARFTGNVVIHVIPKGSGKFKESHIYLDDIVFLSERSEFSTIGPVRFVSKMANMQGKGLRFVYDEQSERLEYLRLTHLESLNIKSLPDALLSDGKPQVVTEPGPGETAPSSKKTAPDRAQVVAPEISDTKRPPRSAKAERPDTPQQPPESRAEGLYYRCILSKNVLIEAPEEVVFAGDSVSINDIFWSKSSASQQDQPDADQTENRKDKQTAPPPKKVVNSSATIDVSTEPAVPADTANEPNEPNEPAKKLVDVIVTCDNGILLLPEDSHRSIEDFKVADVTVDTRRAKVDKLRIEHREKTSFISDTLDYSATTRDTIAAGASDLTFFTDDISDSDANSPDSDPNSPPIPINVKARQGVRYLHAQNRVLFEGDCVCTMPQADLSEPRDATLKSPGITVDLIRDGTGDSTTSADITAAGPVQLDFYVEDPNSDDPNSAPLPVTVTAQKYAKFVSATEQVIFDVNCVCTMPQQGAAARDGYMLEAPRLTVNMAKDEAGDPNGLSDVVASGPARLTFYMDDFGKSAADPPLPATVTARKEARFSALANQIVFDGSCVCLMDRADPNGQYEYKLEAPTLTLDLPADSNDSSTSQTASSGVEHLKAHGGLVRLSTRNWPADSDRSEGQLLGGVVLQCRQFDYDPNEEILIATGPGVIQLNNSHVAQSDPNQQRGSLSRPCYAVVKNFDTLKYFLDQNHIVANAESEGSLLVTYVPLKDGRPEQYIRISAGHVEAFLDENSTGDLELSSLSATEGVFCGDDRSEHQFEGGNLLYDHSQGIVTVTGTEDYPCMFDGAPADVVEYDLQRGRGKARLIGPGTINLNQ